MHTHTIHDTYQSASSIHWGWVILSQQLASLFSGYMPNSHPNQTELGLRHPLGILGKAPLKKHAVGHIKYDDV